MFFFSIFFSGVPSKCFSDSINASLDCFKDLAIPNTASTNTFIKTRSKSMFGTPNQFISKTLKELPLFQIQKLLLLLQYTDFQKANSKAFFM